MLRCVKDCIGVETRVVLNGVKSRWFGGKKGLRWFGVERDLRQG